MRGLTSFSTASSTGTDRCCSRRSCSRPGWTRTFFSAGRTPRLDQHRMHPGRDLQRVELEHLVDEPWLVQPDQVAESLEGQDRRQVRRQARQDRSPGRPGSRRRSGAPRTPSPTRSPFRSPGFASGNTSDRRSGSGTRTARQSSSSRGLAEEGRRAEFDRSLVDPVLGRRHAAVPARDRQITPLDDVVRPLARRARRRRGARSRAPRVARAARASFIA